MKDLRKVFIAIEVELDKAVDKVFGLIESVQDTLDEIQPMSGSESEKKGKKAK